MSGQGPKTLLNLNAHSKSNSEPDSIPNLNPNTEQTVASLPLTGVRVLDFSRLLPGPFCSLLLADMGAEVVKIEEPGQGDFVRVMPPHHGDLSAAFIALNRGKKSLALDLRRPEARAAVHRLVPQFDIVLDTFRPGVMARLGLDYETLKSLHPGLIYCAITGYGQTGPMREKAGHDLNYIALAGILGATGPHGGAPEMPAVQVADVAGGSYPALVSILAALFERTRTGRGRYLDISMTDGALSMMMMGLAGHLADGKGTPANGMALNGGLVNYQTYQCKDGKAIALGSLEPRFWMAFLKRIGRTDLASLMGTQGEELVEARKRMQALFRERTRDEWIELVADSDVCAEPVLDADETCYHPMHRGRGMIRQVKQGDALIELVVGPLPFGREAFFSGEADELPPLPGAPDVGADGAEVLKSAGFSAAEIETLLG